MNKETKLETISRYLTTKLYRRKKHTDHEYGDWCWAMERNSMDLHSNLLQFGISSMLDFLEKDESVEDHSSK